MARQIRYQMPTGKVIDKHAVALSFSRAAASYDGVANIQRWVISQLLARIDQDQPVQRVLDIGCGTGDLTQKIIDHVKPQTVFGLDIAEGMAKVAQQKLERHNPVKCQTLCGDAEALPLPNQHFDLLVSSFALQWCPNLQQVFAEAHRVLNDNGCFYFTLPVTDTLWELKRCWQQVDPINSHVNDFYSEHDLRCAAHSIGFKKIEFTVVDRQEFYPDLKSLTQALKAMGAHNLTQGRAKQLTGKGKIKQLINAYDQHREARGLPATWQVAFGVLEK